MDRLTALRLFVRIADGGSITGAGRGLGISATAASRGLQELEHAIGLRLIDRTTRHATATEAGTALRSRLASVLAELDSALGQARLLHDAPAGTLRVVARRSFALRHVLPHLAAFRAAHPAVEIDLTLTEAPSQLPVEGIDLVIRLGAPAEKSFVAHVLANEHRVLCASPCYLAFRAAGDAGNKTFWVYAHSVANDGWTNKTVTLRYVTAAAPPPAPAPSTATGVIMADFEFRPSTWYAQVGDTVTWTNQGPSAHTATSDTGRWDTGRLDRGQSRSVNFTTAGTYAYHCTIHPGMRGTIVVGSGSAATYTERYRDPYSGLYGSNQYGYNQGYNRYGYNQGYNQYGYNQYYPYSQYNQSPYNQYNQYNQYPYSQYTQYPYNSYGSAYGTAHCANTATGFIVYYYNTANGQYYTSYAQCIAATGTGYGVGNCILSGGYYYNSATGQYYTTYNQCIATGTGYGIGGCIPSGAYYYNSATGQYYATYNQCINAR